MPRTTPKLPIIRGVLRNCTCTPTRGHGNHHTYEYHSCGCDACLIAARRYTKLGRHLHATGRQRRRAADPIRRRLELLKERGLTVKEIAALSEVSFTNLHLILRSRQETVTTRTADAVMSVKVPARVGRRAA